MRKCAAPIHTVATGGCHSAATHILLQSDSFELAANFNSLIHCGSTGAIGTLSEYNSKTSFDNYFIAEMYRKIYEGFLDPDELESMLKGQDFWLDADGWMERYNKRNEYFLAKEAAAKAPAKKPRKKAKKEPYIPLEL
jgi:ATP-dependent protease ClpP protease subunit